MKGPRCGALPLSTRKSPRDRVVDAGPCQLLPGRHRVHKDENGVQFVAVNPSTRQPAPGEKARDRHDALYRRVGAAVRRERTRRYLTQFGLASRSGVVRTTIVNLEHGRQRVPLHVLDDIAAALGCPLVFLLESKAQVRRK